MTRRKPERTPTPLNVAQEMEKAGLLRRPGRPRLHGEVMPSRSVALPSALWRDLDDAAHELRISTSELIRRKLGAIPTGT